MKINKHIKYCLLSLLLLFFFSGNAQFEKMIPENTVTHKAIKNGKWSNPTTWSSNSVPKLGAIVWIPEGIRVNYDVNSNQHIFLIRNDGTFFTSTSDNKKRKLIVDSFLGGRNSFLNINASEFNSANMEIILKPFDIQKKKNDKIGGVQWNENAKAHYSDNKPVTNHFGNKLPSDGSGVLGRYKWDPKQASISLMTWGKVRISGKDKLDFSESSSDILQNQNRIQLKKIPEGWKKGDLVLISGTENINDNEIIEVKEISGNTIILKERTRKNHKGVKLEGTNYYTYVANLTRSISIKSYHTSIEENHTRRGHVMFMFNGDVVIKNTSFKDLGRTNKVNILDDLKIGTPVVTGSGDKTEVNLSSFVNEPETDPSKIENQRGRYALHFHKTLRGQNKENLIIAKGNVVWGSPGWGMVHHDSHADFSDNVVLQIQGGGMVAESGSETGIWKNNFVTGGAPKRINNAPNGIPLTDRIRRYLREIIDDDFKTPSAYALQGRAIEMVDNVASSVSAAYHYQGSGVNVRVADELDTKVFEENGKINPFPFKETVVRTAAPFIRFDGNIAFNCADGFKSQNRSTSGAFNRVSSVVSNMLVWNADRFGIYISTNFGYLIKDSKFHANENTRRQNTTGALIQKDNDNLNFHNITFYNYKDKGVNVNNTLTSNTSANNSNARFIFNKVRWLNSPSNFKPYSNNTDGQIIVKDVTPSQNPRIRFIKSETIDNELDLNGDFEFSIEGEVIDQIGKSKFAHYAPKKTPFLKRVYRFENRQELEEQLLERYEIKNNSKGYYVEFTEYMSDRITAVTKGIKFKIYIKNYIPSNLNSTNNVLSSDTSSFLFPNPSSKNLTINLNIIEAKSDLSEIIISNLNGMIIEKVKLNNNSKNVYNLNIEKYSSGMYLMNLVSNKGAILKTTKFIKK
ncbi:T9SS type A sorting domain-containing protein [Tenacibaculum sp. M341]|uniref:T9SS type A sorting domain-containing protein n=1 Tax=Tenacibaculum sp. M341 TaxID=2530339 RepID=UPI001053088F|nr:T9SS type A sorting domain-containing protein [Tenacibaculum sp. M341]TCI92232.1 T9SS type A sorting domain-containing protein [Tenacibaculum sp. M341]